MFRTFAGNTLIAILISIFSFVTINTSMAQSQEVKENVQRLVALYQLIDYAYIDSVEMSKLVDNAIIETLKELDPHSSYIPKKEVERMEEPLRGNFEGIGISFQIFKDTILVDSCFVSESIFTHDRFVRGYYKSSESTYQSGGFVE